MDNISTRSIALSRQELYILIDALEDECERAEADDYENELETPSDRYNNASKILGRLQILLGE